MVVKIALTIKHIRGDQFEVDIDHEADTLGLKVLIWERENIAVENQRLVFAGRELQDNTKLTDVGVEDGGMIFLVEANQQGGQDAVAEVQASVNAPPPAYAADVAVVSVAVPVEAMNVQSYQPLDADSAAEEKMSAVIDLAFWIRFYCILAMIVVAIVGGVHRCLFALIPFFIYLMGWCGSRKLCRCCLVLPLLLVAAIGIMGMVGIAMFITHHGWHTFLLVPIVFCLLHLCITMCFVVFISRINRLTQSQCIEVRKRIARRGCCC